MTPRAPSQQNCYFYDFPELFVAVDEFVSNVNAYLIVANEEESEGWPILFLFLLSCLIREVVSYMNAEVRLALDGNFGGMR